MSSSLEAVQKGNIILETVANRKQLTLRIPKCSVIAFDRINRANNEGRKLKICCQNILMKEKDEYLGDVLHERGLAMSVKV